MKSSRGSLRIYLLVAIGVVLFLGALSIPVIGIASLALAQSQGPKQPIAFSHQLHIQQVGLQCTFCHRNVEKGPEATIPSVGQCIMCHKVVGSGQPGTEVLRTSFENNQPINWERVYRLPDHVKFVHDPHIRAGLDCSTCHGDVGNMKQVRPARNLRMGDCLDCHRKLNAPTDCVVCHY